MDNLSIAFWLMLALVVYAYLGHGLVFGTLTQIKKKLK